MIFGRTTAAVAVFGTALLFGLLIPWPELGQSSSGPISWWVNGLGVAVAFSMIATWFFAIWHWGTRFPAGPSKGRWGFVVVFGFVLGAATYWAFGAKEL